MLFEYFKSLFTLIVLTKQCIIYANLMQKICVFKMFKSLFVLKNLKFMDMYMSINNLCAMKKIRTNLNTF